MNNLKKPQIWLSILVLIFGLAYMMLKSQEPFNKSINEPKILKEPIKTSNLVISKWQTTNNINVYFVNAPELPMVDIQVTFNAGSSYESHKPGLAAFTNSMLLEGTKNLNTEQIHEKLDSVGANFSTGLSRDSASVSLRSLTEQQKFETALEVFNDVLANSNFPNKSFNRIKNQTIEQLKLNEQYPEVISANLFYKTIYKEHPYGVPQNGTIDSIKNITTQDLTNFYSKYYVNNNAQIAIVGALSALQAKNVAENISKHLNPGSKIAALPQVPSEGLSSSQHIEFPSTQTHILLGSIGIKRSDPDYLPLLVGNHLLGKMPLTSLLFKNVRINRGLAYSVSSQFVTMKDAGPFMISMQTRNEKANEALKISTDTLADFIKNGPAPLDLELAKQNLTGQFPVNIASNSNKLDIISNIGFYDLPLDYLDTYINKVNAVTAQEIVKTFNKHINLNQLTVVTVGNKAPVTTKTL
jgi:zinc protease